MKKVKYIALLLSVLLLIFSVYGMWNMGIASDEQLKVGVFFDKYNYIYWGNLFISFFLVITNFILLRKSNE